MHLQNSDSPSPRQTAVVWWVLWAAFQFGIMVIYAMLSRGSAHHKAPQDMTLPWTMALLPLALSAGLRWLVLPKMRNPIQALPVFVLGVAMAESTTFLGLFLFPAHQRELFLCSVLGIFQFVPVYFARYFGSIPEPGPSLRESR